MAAGRLLVLVLMASLISARSFKPTTFYHTLNRSPFRAAHTVNVDRIHKLVTIAPKQGHSATVIFLHGLGDTALGWSDQMRDFAEHLGHVKFILPTGV
jgi:hypothetical protein